VQIIVGEFARICSAAEIGHKAAHTVARVLQVIVNPPIPSGTREDAWISILSFSSPVFIKIDIL
jgi:hypothetical protein